MAHAILAILLASAIAATLVGRRAHKPGLPAIENKAMDSENNVLKNAPHTVFDLMDESWSRPYTRTLACFPVKRLLRDKYWCPVNRVDNAYGDRHLVCSCPPMESYRSAAE
jgi:glycine dehydrogenase